MSSSDSDPSGAAPHELSMVASQLVEAAGRARQGDREAMHVHIAHALALLRRQPIAAPLVSLTLPDLDGDIARGGLAPWQAHKVLAHIEANLSGKIRIRELARLLDLSAGHFCRAFKCTVGVAPREYVLRRRIEVAQSLMLTTSEPLGVIAVRCGMCDQAHFTRSFHRIVGQTPNNWRRTRQGAPMASLAYV